MRKYLELFRQGFDSTVEEKRSLENWPYVGHDVNGGVVYTVIPAKEEPITWDPYVTFKAEADNSSIGLFKLSTSQTLEYSTDTTTWTTFNTTTNITLNNGDKVYVRGVLSNNNNSSSNYTQFKMTGKIAASGNCNALWNYEDLNAPLKNHCGRNMFYNCRSLITAPKILPATTLADYCYSNMFADCTSLTTAPELPATELAYSCYSSMFFNCTKLNHIKCLATNISATSCTSGWVSIVSSTGTFVKHPDMASWSTGKDGIPEEWTVVDAEL